MGGGQADQRIDESKDSRPAPEEVAMNKAEAEMGIVNMILLYDTNFSDFLRQFDGFVYSEKSPCQKFSNDDCFVCQQRMLYDWR